MGKDTKIRWSHHTWNPVTGCSKVSPGCDHCYAEVIAEKFRGGPAFPNGFDVTLRPKRLREPLGWKEPGRIFVNSMSDLFHVDIPDDYLARIWETMLAADWHKYLILTKRPHRAEHKIRTLGLPLPEHIWMGVTAENQEMADSRLPALARIPAHTRFISAEPLLGPLDLRPWLDPMPDAVMVSGRPPGDHPAAFYQALNEIGRAASKKVWGVHWVIAGGESGLHLKDPANADRWMDKDWARSLRDQCVAAGVAYFYKQASALRSEQDQLLDGVRWEQYPDEVAA